MIENFKKVLMNSILYERQELIFYSMGSLFASGVTITDNKT